MKPNQGAGSSGLRVGVDLARPADVADSVDRFGDRYLRRIYTEAELADAGAEPPVRWTRLAARFAAKEASLKVLRTSTGVDWRDIEVRRDEHGAVGVRLHGRAADVARADGLGPLALSLSHEHDLAVAVVVTTEERR